MASGSTSAATSAPPSAGVWGLSGLLAGERAVMMSASVRLARLAIVDCSSFTREELADHTVAMVRATELANVTTARFMALSDQTAAALTKGQHSMAAVVNATNGVSRRRGSQMNLIGTAWEKYPLFYQALLSGEIGIGHIEVLHPVYTKVDRTQFADCEQKLLDLAMLCTPEEFRVHLEQWRTHADEDSALDNFIRNQAKQHFCYGFDLFGNAHYSGTVGPEHAEPFIESIEAEANNHASDEETREEKTPSQTRGDAIVELVLNPDGKYRARLEVLVPEHDDGPPAAQPDSDIGPDPDGDDTPDNPDTGTDDGGGFDVRDAVIDWRLQQYLDRIERDARNRARSQQTPVHRDRGFGNIYQPRTARGTFIPFEIVDRIRNNGAIVTEHPVNPGGQIADDQVSSRRFSERQKRLIRLRDNHCQHPGCRTPAIRCDTDHIRPYHEWGPTLIRNGQTLCRFHHRFKHRFDTGPNRATIFDDGPIDLDRNPPKLE